MQLDQLKLDSSARQLLEQAGPLSPRAEQLLLERAARAGGTLSAEEVQLLILGAMPEKQPALQQAARLCHRPDNDRPDFVSQLARVIIEKEVAVVQPPQRRGAPSGRVVTVRDPLKGRVLMDQDAAYLAVCNASDVGPGGIAPVLKVIRRECAPPACALDLAGARLEWRRAGDEADVQVVADDALAVDFEDKNEHQFLNGDATFVVAFDARGNELRGGRSGTTKPEDVVDVLFCSPTAGQPDTPDPRAVLDRQRLTGPTTDQPRMRLANRDPQRPDVALRVGRHVRVHPEAVRVFLHPHEALAGRWASALAASFDVNLVLGRGLHHEPGSKVSVSLLGAVASTAVDEALDAWELRGNDPAAAAVPPAQLAGLTLAGLLDQQVEVRSETKPNDQHRVHLLLRDVVFGQAVRQVQVVGAPFVPLLDRALTRDGYRQAGIKLGFLEAGPNQLTLVGSLPAGLLSAQPPGSVQGWRVEVGYLDHAAKWQSAAPVQVTGESSTELDFTLPTIADARAVFRSGHSLEVQIFDAQGVPAARLTVPLKEIDYQR